MENSHLAIFGLRPCTMRPCTIVQGVWPDFGATLKIHKKSKFDRNPFKIFTQHKNMYVHQEM